MERGAEEPGWAARVLNAARAAWMLSEPNLTLSPRFGHSTEKLSALAYEQRVANGEIPTRDVLHDVMNGWVWLHYPRMKAVLNQRHLDVHDAGIVNGAGRGPLRDALTLWDENGAILLCSDRALANAVLRYDWPQVFGPAVHWYPHWPDVQNILPWCTDGQLKWVPTTLKQKEPIQPARWAQLYLLGHGLMEAMVEKPHPGLCAKVVVGVVNSNQKVDLDACAFQVVQQLVAPVQLAPLPVVFPTPVAMRHGDLNPAVFRPPPKDIEERLARRMCVFC